jgi:Tol biopolymer transport system component
VTQVAVKMALALVVVWALVVMGARVVGEWLPSVEIAFSGRIIYPPSNADIYRLDIGHHRLVNVTRHETDDSQPTWSLDGKQLAFLSRRDGDQALFIMNAEGDYLQRFTNYGDDILFPNWSPNGEYIAYLVRRRNALSVQILNISTGDIWEMPPLYVPTPARWASDSQHLAYTLRTGQSMIVDMYSNETELIGGSFPVFTPISNDDRLAYVETAMGVSVTEPQENTVTRILHFWDVIEAPVWSPNGAYIAFAAGMQGSVKRLFIADADGTNLHPLPIEGNILQPQWLSSDELIFSSGVEEMHLILNKVNIHNETITWLASIPFLPDDYWSYAVRP